MVPIAGPVRRSRAESVPSRGCDVKLRVSGRRRPLAERPPCRRLGVACGSVHAERTEEITPSVAKARCRRQPRAPVSSPRREKRPTCLHAKLGEGGVPAERSSEFVAFPPREAANLSSRCARRRRGAGVSRVPRFRRPAARRVAAASGGPVPHIQLDIVLPAAIITSTIKEALHDLPGLSRRNDRRRVQED